MSITTTSHYTHGDLLERMEQAMHQAGYTRDSITVEQLAAGDEFHIGGRSATAFLLEQLDLSESDNILDVGCGLGGTARYIASETGASVHGVDLTEEFVNTGNQLNEWVGLADKITLQQGSATELPVRPDSFDHAVMLHVGMNISDKQLLCNRVYNALKPGGSFVLYDVMRLTDDALVYPLPWASEAAISFPEPEANYTNALQGAGFDNVTTINRAMFAREFFTRQKKRAEEGGSPPFGLHVVMGSNAALKLKNLAEAVFSGVVAPVQMMAKKPD